MARPRYPQRRTVPPKLAAVTRAVSKASVGSSDNVKHATMNYPEPVFERTPDTVDGDVYHLVEDGSGNKTKPRHG